MSRLLIDRYSDALSWEAIIPLEGTEYLFRYYWSTRESIWYLSLYNQNNQPLALWMALLVNAPPLRRFRAQDNIPPGMLIVCDTTGQGQDMTQPTDLGGGWLLGYITSDDPLIAGVSLVGRG